MCALLSSLLDNKLQYRYYLLIWEYVKFAYYDVSKQNAGIVFSVNLPALRFLLDGCRITRCGSEMVKSICPSSQLFSFAAGHGKTRAYRRVKLTCS